jgi:hypothetical protein
MCLPSFKLFYRSGAVDKKPSFLWALAIGALFPVLQLAIFLFRFNRWNTDAPVIEYLFFYISGAMIGLGVIYFLRRSENKGAQRGTIIGFVIGIPFALFGMTMGGLAGPLGAIILGMSPGVFMTAVGYFLGLAFSKK